MWPKEREIDLERYSNFSVLHHLPLIYNLRVFGITTEACRIEDFRQDGITDGLFQSASDSAAAESGEQRKITDEDIMKQQQSDLFLQRSKYLLNKELVKKFPSRSGEQRWDSLFEGQTVVGAATHEGDLKRQKELQVTILSL